MDPRAMPLFIALLAAGSPVQCGDPEDTEYACADVEQAADRFSSLQLAAAEFADHDPGHARLTLLQRRDDLDEAMRYVYDGAWGDVERAVAELQVEWAKTEGLEADELVAAIPRLDAAFDNATDACVAAA